MELKKDKKNLARALRYSGKSYSQILGEVNVSKSTLSLWLRDIPLTKIQQKILTGRQKSRFIASKNRQKDRIERTKKIISEAQKDACKKSKDPFFISGLMLYWAEGTKRGQEAVSFSNSDPNMIILMMKWFRRYCLVDEKRYRLQIHVHDRLINSEVIDYWSKICQIPKGQFHKLIVKKSSLLHRKNRLYNGTCAIRISDRNLFRKIMGWKTGILKGFGIDDIYKIPK